MHWLSVMQHYGCPTRLLDWTYSLWIALLFALEIPATGKSAAVWALNADWWREAAKATFPQDLLDTLNSGESKSPKLMHQIFGLERKVVWPANPLVLNKRLAIQQGTFLACGDPGTTFESGLQSTAGEADSSPHLIKITICLEQGDLHKFMADLQRMNLTRATLYPGLVGYAESLPWRLIMDRRYDGVDKEKGFGAFAVSS